MKVICVDAKADGSEFVTGFLIENKIYTVVQECIIINVYGKTEIGYALEGIPEYGFPKYKFVPLSEIDETELAEQRKEVQHV